MLQRSLFSSSTTSATTSASTSFSTTTGLNFSFLSCSSQLSIAARFNRVFSLPPQRHRRSHTHLTLNYHNSNFLGGRTAYFRYHGKPLGKKHGAEWKKHRPTVDYNIDVWAAQQTLRKKWKGRDYRVVELPFEAAPAQLQKVIPEEYTELPMMSDPANGDFSNIRRKTFAQEDLQEALFGKRVLPNSVERNVSDVKLDSFFSNSGFEGTPR